jgi:hypothetical protein
MTMYKKRTNLFAIIIPDNNDGWIDFICSKKYAGFMKQQNPKQKLVYFRKKKHSTFFGRTVVLKAPPFHKDRKDWVFCCWN